MVVRRNHQPALALPYHLHPGIPAQTLQPPAMVLGMELVAGEHLLALTGATAELPRLQNPGRALTSDPLLPQLPLLNEAPEHLCLHEDLQEASEALGGDRLAESLTLQDPLLSLGGGQEEGVVAHNLHKETDKGLRHHLIQRAGL